MADDLNTSESDRRRNRMNPRRQPRASFHTRTTSDPGWGQMNANLSVLERQWSVGGRQPSLRGSSPFAQPEDSPFGMSWGGIDFGNASFSGANTSQAFASFLHSSSSSSMSVTPSSAIPPAPPIVRNPSTSQALSTDDKDSITSIIHDEARITNWDRVLELAKSHPRHCKYAGLDGWTALHHACNRRCPRPDVVEALIRAYPDALLDLEEKGMTPLHYACRFKAPKEAVRLLLYLFPKKGQAAVSKHDRQGRTPLYYAVRYEAPQQVVELLLEVDPSAVLNEDKKADSPLALVWDLWAEKLEGKQYLQPFLYPASDMTPKLLWDKIEASAKFKKRWDTVNKLLRAAYLFKIGDQEKDESQKSDESKEETSVLSPNARKWRILHGTAAIKCHSTLFRMAKALYPEQASELDKGELYLQDASVIRTALHFAAAAPTTQDKVIEDLLGLNPQAAQTADGVDGGLPFHVVVENSMKVNWLRDGAQRIYDVHPMAATVEDTRKRLPLHRAAATQSQHLLSKEDENDRDYEARSVICQLVLAHAPAAAAPDVSGRLPMHWLAENGEEWTRAAHAILGAHEPAVRARTGRDAGSSLPLHLAASNPRAKQSLLAKLVELHPRGASQPNGAGKLPLHLACESGKRWEGGVNEIYNAFPDAVREIETNQRGWSALQMAAASENDCGDLIVKLLELWPEAAHRQDADGRFALHLACASGKRWGAGLKALFDANPDAMMNEDKKKCLPFHVAAFRFKAVEEKNEEEKPPTFNNRSTLSRSRQDVSLQREEMAREGANLQILYELLRAHPSICSYL